MPFIPPETIERARQMDLLTYLRTFEPDELVHIGGNHYCTREHDSLKISNGKWYWFSRGFGGYNALDYLVKVKEVPFLEAVERISGVAAYTPPVASRTEQVKKPKVLLLPKLSLFLCSFMSWVSELPYLPAATTAGARNTALPNGAAHRQSTKNIRTKDRNIFKKKGGTIWSVMVGIHGAVKAIGLALIVLFFVMGVMKTCGSFADLKRPEVAVKVFVRFALAKAAVTHGANKWTSGLFETHL